MNFSLFYYAYAGLIFNGMIGVFLQQDAWISIGLGWFFASTLLALFNNYNHISEIIFKRMVKKK